MERPSAPATHHPPPATRYYQLTHDYLVPALRQWLTRKQRETRRGRMELLLEERTALWSAKQESRQLPGWWEWFNIILLTRRKDWATSQCRMLRAATRKHSWQAGVLAIVLAVIGGAVVAIRQGPVKASALVQALASAETVKVPDIMKDLSPWSRRWADPLLRTMADGSPDDSKQRLHASLALLEVDPERKNYLLDKLLSAEADEFPILREALEKHHQEIVPKLWHLVEGERDPKRRFRAICALSNYDPRNPSWEGLGDTIADILVKEDPRFFRWWGRVLAMARHDLRISQSLERMLRDPDLPESQRAVVAELMVAHTARDHIGEHERDLLLEAEGKPYDVLLPHFIAEDQQQDMAHGMKAELARPSLPGASDKEKDVLAKRQAHAAVVLLQLDQRDDVWPLHQGECIWPMLQKASDPRLRSFLIHRLGRVRVDPESFIGKYLAEQDDSVRQALLLSLGQFEGAQLLPARRQTLAPRLLEDYRNHAEASVHAAADWLLRQWKKQELLEKIDSELATGKVEGNRRWYLNRQGQTLVLISPPRPFAMGSSDQEADRTDGERLHQKRIPRSFALAAKEVTIGQFQKFLSQYPDLARRWENSLQEHSPDEPVVGATWFEAVKYCRWLSEREEVPEEEMCYPPVTEINEGMKLVPGYLSRMGYRLPTEAEWEYACRAGAATSRHFGSDEAMLGPYAWYGPNAQGRLHPVGTKMPNDYGLFDMYGNAAEWCHDAFAPYPSAKLETAIEDHEDLRPVDLSRSRVLRGGAYFSSAGILRSAARSGFQPQHEDRFRRTARGPDVALTNFV
jgi:formylglycine-generating enzyme required for sulfatase activity